MKEIAAAIRSILELSVVKIFIGCLIAFGAFFCVKYVQSNDAEIMRYQDDRKYQDQQYRELYATYREEHQELNDCRKENRALADTATMVMRRVQSTLQELKKR